MAKVRHFPPFGPGLFNRWNLLGIVILFEGVAMTKKRFWAGITIILATAMIAAAVFVLNSGSLRDVTNGELVVPSSSPVQISYSTEDFGASAHVFLGNLVISGTYYYGFEEADSAPAAFIVPDEASAAVLPYWKRWGPPKRIDLTNPDDFAKSALSRSIMGEITRKKRGLTHGHIVVMASEYEVTGECDQPIYLAKFKSVLQPRNMVASIGNTATNCG